MPSLDIKYPKPIQRRRGPHHDARKKSANMFHTLFNIAWTSTLLLHTLQKGLEIETSGASIQLARILELSKASLRSSNTVDNNAPSSRNEVQPQSSEGDNAIRRSLQEETSVSEGGDQPVTLSSSFYYGNATNHNQLALRSPEGKPFAFQLRDIPEYIEVLENFMPHLHSEGGVCQVGESELWMIGGFDMPTHENGYDFHKDLDFQQNRVNGTDVVSIYDMKDSSVRSGPTFPEKINHAACAISADGIIHIVGGYMTGRTLETKFETSDRHWTLDTKAANPTWIKKAPLPKKLGAQGCVFAYDGFMYCLGGGRTQTGPFVKDNWVYMPEKDKWKQGPSMRNARDHIFESVKTIDGGKRIYVVGGRSHTQSKRMHVNSWTLSGQTEILDIATGNWALAQSPQQIFVNSIQIAPYTYHGAENGTSQENLLLVGGQRYMGYSGLASNTIEEYDIAKDIYYCRESLPYSIFGGIVGVYEGKLHAVGGAQWLGQAATARVQIYDLKKAPPAKPCFYYPIPVFDTWIYNEPFPPVNDMESPQSRALQTTRNIRFKFK